MSTATVMASMSVSAVWWRRISNRLMNVWNSGLSALLRRMIPMP